MKTRFFTFFTILFWANHCLAQAVESKITFNKTSQNGVMAEFQTENSILETVLTDDLKSKGFGKGKSSSGFTLYQGINFNEISADKIDLYVKTDKKSKKEKDKSIIYVLVSKGYDNFISSSTEPVMMTALINYINSLKPKLESSNLELQIKEQEELLKKEEKKQNNYIDDLNDLEKKKRNIEDDIVKKKNDIEKQKTEVEKQRQFLEALKQRRKI